MFDLGNFSEIKEDKTAGTMSKLIEVMIGMISEIESLRKEVDTLKEDVSKLVENAS